MSCTHDKCAVEWPIGVEFRHGMSVQARVCCVDCGHIYTETVDICMDMIHDTSRWDMGISCRVNSAAAIAETRMAERLESYYRRRGTTNEN